MRRGSHFSLCITYGQRVRVLLRSKRIFAPKRGFQSGVRDPVDRGGILPLPHLEQELEPRFEVGTLISKCLLKGGQLQAGKPLR